jgi:uncharacterized protein with FMN-binding domain
MGLFRKESTWNRLTSQAADVVPTRALKSGATAVGTVVGATLVSAAVSAVRRRQQNA